jgi:AraC-like DNA-binding protein
MLKEDRDVPVIRIAHKVGFNSKSSFNTVFAKATGQTPTDFRRGP